MDAGDEADGDTRMLDAAERLFSEKGFDSVSLADVAADAEMDEDAVRARLGDEPAAFAAVHRRFCDRARALADDLLDPQRWEGVSTAELLGNIAGIAVTHFRSNAGLHAAIRARSLDDPQVLEPNRRLVAYVAVKLRRLLWSRREEIDHPDPELAVAFSLQVLFGTLMHLAFIQPPGLGIDDDRLARELTRLVGRYVGVAV